MNASNLIYGCMGLGGNWDDAPVTNADEKKAEAAIMAALESGINTFDHADIYTFGKAESVFGSFLKNHPELRGSIKLQSKAGIRLGTAPGNSNSYDLSKEYLLSQIESTLQRLNCDYLDIFLFHRPDPLTAIEQLVETLLTIEEKGYAKRFGVSNMSVSQIDVLQQRYEIPISANQIQFSLGHTALIDYSVEFNTNSEVDASVSGMLEYTQLHKMDIQAWGSLDQGLYTNLTRKAPNKTVEKTHQLLQTLAKKYDSSPIAIQLAWAQQLPCSLRPIIGTTSPERIKQCAASANIELSKEDWYALWVTARDNVLP